MRENYYDYFNEIEDDEVFDEDRKIDFESEESYPTAEEYNRIYKQRHDYF